jgi:cell wall-associated NlpC family hydrolase
VTATTGPLALAALGALCAPTAQAAPTTVQAADTAPAARNDAGYTVVAGDTLSTIATAHHSTVAALAAANHLASPDVLAVGQHLDLGADDAPAPRSGRHATATGTAAAPHAATSGVVGTARTWIGTAYEWGGTTRSGVDCSGLTSQVFSANGTRLPRTADAQMNATTRITRDQARPGDLVFGVSADGTAHHVGIYLGGGQQIDAPDAGETVGVHRLYRDQTVFGRVG